MSTTPCLDLPYLAAGQAQKHVTLNESLRKLDALIQIRVVSRAIGTPPSTPVEGARYLLPSSLSGVWVDKAGQIAAWQDGGWVFFEAGLGWVLYVEDEALLIVNHASGWGLVSMETETLSKLGINASADETNRLVAASPATLLTHVGGGHQLKLNKATMADTASLLFQTGYSGRVEIGTAGDDRFTVKSSSDGQAWITAMTVLPNGYIGIGTTGPSSRLHVEGAIRPGSYTVAGLPSPYTSGPGAIVFVTNAAGGSVLAFCDGANWVRISDRTVVTT